MDKTNFGRTLLLFLFLGFSVFSYAEIKLPAIFGDYMVLQQQTDAPIWGKATPGKIVRLNVSWDKKSYSVRADQNGNWMIKVKTPKAGGPYEIIVSDGSILKLKEVLIGEVWVCSGQSNMQMSMKGAYNLPVMGSNEAIVTSKNPDIRLFTVKSDKSPTPKDDFKGEWKECLPENVASFSATAYYFGKMVQQVLGIPVGLVNSSVGGSRIESWMSKSGFDHVNKITLPEEKVGSNISQNSASLLFNAMIKPMAGYGIRGAIWYQGEANRNDPGIYQKLMTGLVANWRTEWGMGDMPFFYVQIAPYDYGPIGLNSAYLREAQLKALNDIPNSGMACLMDAGEKYNIHPHNKKAAGDRLAYLALAKTYGITGFAFSGPVLKEMMVEGSFVNLTFDYAVRGLTSFGKELENFEIAGENRRFYPAKVIITRNGLTLYSQSVTKPVAVRYAFKDFVVGDLFNSEGLPASSFRTDDW